MNLLGHDRCPLLNEDGVAVARGRGIKGRATDWCLQDIVDLVQSYVPLKRAGAQLRANCPFHNEKTPSFYVNPVRQSFHCFGCGASGDVFKFVQETEKVGFLEAVELLSRRAGIPVPARRSAERGRRAPLLEALEATHLPKRGPARAAGRSRRATRSGAEIRHCGVYLVRGSD